MELPRGIRNNNPFNIVDTKTEWKGESGENKDKRFEEFKTMEDGIRAGMIILRTYIEKHKLNSVRKIITRFAPSVENDTWAYINFVCKRTGIGRDELLQYNKWVICKLTEAICFHENGGSYITNTQINKAWDML